METTKIKENTSLIEQQSDKTSSSSKTQPDLDFSNLISELTKINKEGGSLFKESKLEQAKNKYLEGCDIFEKERDKSLNLYTIHPQVEQILSLYKLFLSEIAKCLYEQKKYQEAISFDLKLICWEPQNIESIVRLFSSYSKINKIQQALYYGELLLEKENEIKEKYKDIIQEIEKEKVKMINASNLEKNMIKTIFFNLIIIVIVFYSAKFIIKKYK